MSLLDRTMLTRVRNDCSATLPTPPYEAATLASSSDIGGESLCDSCQSRLGTSPKNPVNEITIRLPRIHQRPAAVDAGVGTDPPPETRDAGTQCDEVGSSAQDAEMSELARDDAATEALLARIAELETRNRALLSANRTLLQRDAAFRKQKTVQAPPAPRKVRETPLGLVLALKYREESPWRRRFLQVVAGLGEENHQLRSGIERVQGNNAQFMFANTQLADKNAMLTRELEKLQKANQNGSEVLARERDKIRQLLLENQRIHTMFNIQRDRVLALGEKAQRTLALTTPATPDGQFAAGGASQQVHLATGVALQQMRPQAGVPPQTATGVNQPAQMVAGGAPQQPRPPTANATVPRQTRPPAASKPAKARKPASKAARPPAQQQTLSIPTPPQLPQLPSPQNEVFQQLSRPLQQSLMHDLFAQQQVPSPGTAVPPRPTLASAPGSATQTPLQYTATPPTGPRPGTAQSLPAGPSQQPPDRDRWQQALRGISALDPEQKHDVLQGFTPDQIDLLFRDMPARERQRFCPTFFQAPD